MHSLTGGWFLLSFKSEGVQCAKIGRVHAFASGFHDERMVAYLSLQLFSATYKPSHDTETHCHICHK